MTVQDPAKQEDRARQKEMLDLYEYYRKLMSNVETNRKEIAKLRKKKKINAADIKSLKATLRQIRKELRELQSEVRHCERSGKYGKHQAVACFLLEGALRNSETEEQTFIQLIKDKKATQEVYEKKLRELEAALILSGKKITKEQKKAKTANGR